MNRLTPAMRALMMAHALGSHMVGPRKQITDGNRAFRRERDTRNTLQIPVINERMSAAHIKRLRKQAKRMGAVELPPADAVVTSRVPR